MKQSDLWRKFADMVDLCEGTGIDPWKCVKFDGVVWGNRLGFEALPKCYQFALAIVEGKPVFEGDELYTKDVGKCIAIKNTVDLQSAVRVRLDGGTKRLFKTNSLSWNPPKRIFLLNGEELPLPKDEYIINSIANMRIIIYSDGQTVGEQKLSYNSYSDMKKVFNSLEKLLRGE